MRRVDLLLGLDELATQARDEAAAGRWLDAYLLAAGAWQVCEDLHVGAGPSQLSVLRHAAAHRTGRALWALERAWRVRELWARGRARWGRGRRLGLVESTLARVLVELARRVLEPAAAQAGDDLLRDLDDVALLVEGLPRRDRVSVCTPPSSFRSFDQRPEDVVSLVERLLETRDDLEGPVVVGVRTSGAYLAPLAVAALGARGVSGAVLVSMRPGAHLNPYALDELCRRGVGAEFLVLDDPPTTGSALVAVARALRRFADPAHVTLLVATTTDDGSLPAELDGHPRVTLGWDEWTVRHELEGAPLEEVVTAALGPRETLLGLTVLDRDDATRRGHARTTVRAAVAPASGSAVDRVLTVRGVGLGYLGGDALAVAEALGDAVVRPLALEEAILVEESPAPLGATPPDPGAVVDYLARRAGALGVARDRSADRHLARTVYEVAASLTVRSLGPRASLVATAVLEPTVRRALRVGRPCVIDGAMGPRHWGDRDGRPVKRDYADGAFSSRDLACYDLAFDLVSSALDGDDARASALRDLYGRTIGEEIDDERWLLYSLVSLWDRARGGELDRGEYARRRSAAVIEYLAAVYLADVAPTGGGPVVALDLDGVLETIGGGYSAPGALGMTSLRALLAHGYRIVIATGRSAGEVALRVRSLRLAGGVAEYGSAVVAEDGAVRSTLTEGERELLQVVRTRVGGLEGFEVDPGFTHSIRVAHRRHGGRLPGPERERLIRAAGLDDGSALASIPGVHQVDLVAGGVTKATGLAALLEGEGAAHPLVRLAVGDTAADRPLLERAALGVVPRNADAEVRRGGFTAVRGGFQAGVADAVALEIGHRPGGCAVCRPPAMGTERSVIVRALSLDEAGPGPALTRTVRLLLGASTRRH